MDFTHTSLFGPKTKQVCAWVSIHSVLYVCIGFTTMPVMRPPSTIELLPPVFHQVHRLMC